MESPRTGPSSGRRAANVGSTPARLAASRSTCAVLMPTVGTPFCDVGWAVRETGSGAHLVVGFALDNLLKGAASQAVQNLNLALGLPEALGLLPGVALPEPALS